MRRISLVLCAIFCLIALTVVLADDTEEKKSPSSEITVVDWKQLAQFLPSEVEGFEAGDLDGGTMNMADPTKPGNSFSMSTVSLEFHKGDETYINFSIVDGSMNPMALAPYTMMQMEYDGPDGSMKISEIKGHKAILTTDKHKGTVEERTTVVIIGERLVFVTEASGDVPEEKINSLVETRDFDGLTELMK